VDVLRDGESALDRAEHEENTNLVICDLKMRGMDGQKFFQLLGMRRNPLQGRVLFVTGDLVTPRTQEFLERHRCRYVAKPFGWRAEPCVRGMLQTMSKHRSIQPGLRPSAKQRGEATPCDRNRIIRRFGHRPKGAPAGRTRRSGVALRPGRISCSEAGTNCSGGGRMSGSWTRTASPVRGGF